LKPISAQEIMKNQANINNITGIILAGGQNRRMGQNKALVLWKGKRLIDWVFDALSPLCSNIIVSSNEKITAPQNSLIVPDRHRNIGPLAGIEAGLYHSTTNLNIIVSCDTPMLTTEFFRHMISMHKSFEISLPVHDGVNEPMIGVYNRSILPIIQNAISSGLFKPPALIKSCNYQEVPIHAGLNFYNPDLFLNLNSPDDLKNN